MVNDQPMDITFCPFCGGYIEAGGDSTCTCEDEEYEEDQINEE